MAGMPSIKRTLIAKSNTTIVVVTSTACFVVVFCLVSSLSLLNQLNYQNRVIGADKKALNQLKVNVQAAQSLETSYGAFTGTSTNIIGGNPQGSGAQDGSNTKIVLDALPSKYDFPALATSLENLLVGQGVSITSITGQDDAANQSADQSSSQPLPQPMPFQVAVGGDYSAIQKVVDAFDKSVRPFQVQTLDVTGDQSRLVLTISAQTFWQPARNLSNKTSVVK